MTDSPSVTLDPLSILACDNFSLGACSIIQYNPHQPSTAHLFPDDYLSQLYTRMKSALILERTFCGMTNLDHDSIVPYLASKPVFAAIEWDPDHTQFRTLGFGFIVAWVGTPPSIHGPRSALAAYAMFPEAWGSPEAEVLGMLGLAQMFHTYSLQSIYGQRYPSNALTARFMRRFGFVDLATLPDFMPRRGVNGIDLAPCVVSRLGRSDFSDYISRQLLSIQE